MSDTTKKKMDAQLRTVAAYEKVFSGREGQRVLDDLMHTHGILSSSLNSPLDPNQVLVNEGERNVVLRIIKMLKMDTKQIRQRIEEYERENS